MLYINLCLIYSYIYSCSAYQTCYSNNIIPNGYFSIKKIKERIEKQ